MNRREFFGLFGGLLAALVMPKARAARELPDKAELRQYVYALPEQHGNWPILPVYNGPSRDYTITWHNTGINQWPNIS